jgi:hypothetical protein
MGPVLGAWMKQQTALVESGTVGFIPELVQILTCCKARE